MAVLWGVKQALRSCIAKGSLHEKLMLLTGAGGLSGSLGLAPQKVADSYSAWATGDTHQRKVFYDGSNCFLYFWNGIDPANERWMKLATSPDGENWTVNNDAQFSVGPGALGHAGNYDAALFPTDKTQLYYGYIGSADQGVSPRLGVIDGTTITSAYKFGCAVIANSNANGGHICITPKPRYFSICHQFHASPEIQNFMSVGALNEDYGTVCTTHNLLNVEHSSTTGGVQMLPYKTASPWDCLILLKDKNDLLWWSFFRDSTRTADTPFTSLGVTLTSGFSSFCACSEAQSAGDPERIHLVYVKSTGELCYRKFENDSWSSEKVLVSSGASYSVIAVGNGGRLYVFYVKDGEIKLLKFNGTSWRSEKNAFTGHAYNNPAYLSSNQNVQHGQICLVWTEGTSAPYEVWFCTIGD